MLELLTMQLSPDDVLVAMRIDFVDGLDSQRIERVSTEIEQELTSNFPTVRHVFLDATKSTQEQRELSRMVQRLASDDAAGDPDAALRLTQLERERDPT